MVMVMVMVMILTIIVVGEHLQLLLQLDDLGFPDIGALLRFLQVRLTLGQLLCDVLQKKT